MRLRKWAETSDEGDRDELVPGVTDQAWRQVSVSARECIGASRCPFADECFSELARERAGNADVIVTNHAMLAIAAFEGLQVLPEFDAVIVDEAHEFADRVTGAVTAQLSGSMVRAAATTARRHGALAVNDLSEAAELLDAAYATAPSGWLKQGPNPMQVVALEAIRDASRQGLSDLKAGSTPDDGETKQANETAERHLVRSRLQELIEVTERILDSGPGNATQQVAWATRPGHFEPGQGWITGDETEPPLLFVAPLSIAGRLRENLLAEATCVLTSATLTIGSSFDPIAGSLGFAGAGAPQWTGIDVGSPFDYPSQGILYVAGHLPKPGRFATEEFYQELEELIRASNGGVLGLFSSRRAAEEAAEEMRQRMGRNPKILCQGDATLSALVREFSEEQDSCLFGTMSLWQGVDVPGRACRLVIIDRIPFPRPDDPLSTARAHDISKHGGNGFMRVSASHAAVRLAQGAGRLIRSTGDRGVVAVLDSRLHSARYGQFLRSTLPDFWYTHDGQITKSALRRLGEDKGQ